MSTKRQSKKKPSRKKEEQLYATVTATDDTIKVIHDRQHDKIEFAKCEVDFLHHKVTYQRKSGKDKIVSSILGENDKAYLDIDEYLRSNVDFLFSVDTNTTLIRGIRTSFCVSYHVPQMLHHYKSAISFLPFMVFEINEVSDEVNPECVGWHLLTEQIDKNPAYSLSHQIAIVVDSELDLLPRMNRRDIPYYSDNYLPTNIRLIYASADTGKNYLTNQMISYCDRLARKVNRYFVDQDIELSKSTNGDKFFRGYRLISSKMPTDDSLTDY